MKNIIELMMQCIKCEIFGFQLEKSYFDHVSAEEWNQVYALSKAHDLSHVVGNFALKNNYISDPRLKSNLQQEAMMALARFTRQEYELEQISGILEKEKIPFVVLKGAVIRKLYPEAWLRTSCDIDILVEEDKLEQAKKALVENLNYSVRGRGHHDISMFSPSGVHLELHFSIEGHTEAVNSVLKKALRYAQPIVDTKAEERFSPEFFLLYLIAHLHKHFILGGCGVRPFIDLKLLLEKTDFDPVQLNKLLKKAGLQEFYKKCAQLSHVWFGSGEYDDFIRTFESYVLKGGVYGSVKNRALSEQSQSGKTQSFISRIFMSYESLSIRYADKSVKKWQLPYYQILRWLDLMKEGSFQKGMQELKLQATMPKSEVDEIHQMMRELGLQK